MLIYMEGNIPFSQSDLNPSLHRGCIGKIMAPMFTAQSGVHYTCDAYMSLTDQINMLAKQIGFMQID